GHYGGIGSSAKTNKSAGENGENKHLHNWQMGFPDTDTFHQKCDLGGFVSIMIVIVAHVADDSESE
ncbi:MAG: hypothetical protein P8I56_01610, partial [Paracoccaceae bacterium]|nr:hypothetical protein [Paracoccaceae bacterium]